MIKSTYFQQCLVVVLILTASFTANAQVIENPVHTDTIKLNIAATTSDIQWQRSTDGSVWTDISGANDLNYDYIVNTLELPLQFRAMLSKPACETTFSTVQSVTSDMPSYYWSDFHAWNSGTVPVNGEQPSIPEGRRIYLDVNTATLTGLTINGELVFLERDLTLTSDWVAVHGLLRVGDSSQLFTHKAIFNLTGTNTSQSVMGMGTRGILVMDGALELHAATPDVIWTKINQHALAGSQSIELLESVDWNNGDEIVIAPTDYYAAAGGASITQRLTLNNNTGTTVSFTQGLNASRWGLLQYPTPTGMSLSNTDVVQPPLADSAEFKTPLVLDERAAVGHLTRNIVIQCPNDNLWTTEGFGVHVMVMGSDAQAHINGVEFKRGGQRGRLGRYPMHWHMLSYSGNQTLEDATGQYLVNSVINESRNRGVVIHGTNGLTIAKNVVYDIEGHGIFTEDAVERRNVIDSNLVLKVRNTGVPDAQALKRHETASGRGASGFWLSNPDNVVTNNHAADCGNNGFWLSYPAQPWGESISVLGPNGVLYNPSLERFGVFDNNTAHSNGNEGIMLDFVEINNLGEVYPNSYRSTIDNTQIAWPYDNLRRFTLSNYKVWKNSGNGIWDRSLWATNYGNVSADNCGRFFAGAGDGGIIERTLAIGTSLNHLMNGTDRPLYADFASLRNSPNPAGFATYHSTFDIKNNIAINFPAAEQVRSGVFSTDDYYIRPVDKGQYRNVNNLIINSHAGARLVSPLPHFALAGALWDPNGIWGPDSNFVVYDIPFLTYNKPVTLIAPTTAVSGGVSVPGPFYGFQSFVLHGVGNTPPQNQPWSAFMGIKVRRLDSTFTEVAQWNIESAAAGMILPNMRHFSTTPNGFYELTFPDEVNKPTNFQMDVENMLTSSDQQVLAIEFDGTITPTVSMQSYGAEVTYTNVGSRDAVINSAGGTWWQDPVNNLVWVKVVGGSWQFWTNDPEQAVPVPDELLYETTILRIRP